MIEISSDKTKLDIEFIHNFLKTSYWAKGVTLGIVLKSIDNSFCFGVYRSKNQIGFARVITDYATFAYLADVFIDPNEQQKGYGKRLLRHIFDCKDLQGLRRWHLITADATLFYQDQGFSEVSVSKGHMELRIRPDYLEARC